MYSNHKGKMVAVKLLFLASILQSTISVYGLDMNELHKETFPSHASKRQYMYGEVVPSSRDGDGQPGKKPFQMHSMFSSAMGNKLKRLVSHIDSKMQNKKSENSTSKKEVKDDSLMMSKNQDRKEESVQRSFSRIPAKRSQYEDARSKLFKNHYKPSHRRMYEEAKRLVYPVYKEEPSSEYNDNDSDENGTPIWLDGPHKPMHISSRIPPGYRRRESPDEDKREDKSMEVVQKKDDEVVDNFNFFKNKNEVMTELKRIFVEDDGKDVAGHKEKEAKNSENSKEKQEEKEAEENQQELIDEYIKYMAQVLSVKKRSSMQFLENEEGDELREAEEMNERLQRIEDLILDEANEIMEDRGYENPNLAEYMVMNRVAAAKDLESIRKSLIDLEKVMYNIKQEDFNEPSLIFRKRGNKLTNALGVMAPPDRKRRYDPQARTDEDMMPSSNELERYEVPETDDCPEEELYTRDCSLLTNFLPNGDYKKYFRSACSDHQMCYVCMNVYGVTESECDSGFLQEASTICENNKPCKTATKTMVLSNRRKRAMIKDSDSMDNCIVNMCMRASSDRRR